MLVDILTAVCLALVLQGILPFLNPGLYKRGVRALLDVPDSQLRVLGLSSMIAGVIFLAVVR